MKETITELCPNCGTEVEILWDITIQGHMTKCPCCGKQLMLCSECGHAACDYDQSSDLCRRVVEAMWMELSDIPMETPDSEEEFFAESFILCGIAFPAGIKKIELLHWFDEHHPIGVYYLLYEFERTAPLTAANVS